MADERTQRRVEALMAKADGQLARGRFKSAWKTGLRLYRLRFSGSYEIRAKAYEGLGRPLAARAILARGVRRAPNAPMLWSLFGAALSDAGLYDQAIRAFETGRGIESNANLAVFRGNQALALVRAGRLHEAEALLAAAPAGEPGAETCQAVALLNGVRADLDAARQLPSSS
ncbi:hypothetical protein V7S57_19200 [Caulobacter sp. CCNWLY153]|jgi:tetratricopeptide (TPR) repeat protein|uniref:Tetratricopeptide repeat protein n=1 Tax=Caulobacter radicis TaxID=2172650 RepID=A0A2T9JB76_9CAUL|nr:hypothetical protein [Caulobacter radicis]PVM79472.1 hypothetical protein DDF65_14580 [Caulobacter radicis]